MGLCSKCKSFYANWFVRCDKLSYYEIRLNNALWSKISKFELFANDDQTGAMKRTFKLSILIIAAWQSTQALAADEYTAELYDLYCKSCHSVSGAGVPVAFKKNDWDKRLKKGFEKVVDNAINGIGNMPAQGLCQECTYEDFEDLISYMADPTSKE